jgi:hypothetical protein
MSTATKQVGLSAQAGAKRPAGFYRLSAVCQPTAENVVAVARNRQYRLLSTWRRHDWRVPLSPSSGR